MKIFLTAYFLLVFITPAEAVTTKMFKVLDTCARYRLREFDAFQAIEKLKLKPKTTNEMEYNQIVSKYCSVFTPNETIKY